MNRGQILCRGFPTDFPDVGSRCFPSLPPGGGPCDGRGFPTDFPDVGWRAGGRWLRRRGFPTDFPDVGYKLCESPVPVAVVSLQISLM